MSTFAVRIPSPLKGYLNLGDCAVLLAGWLLSPVYGFLAAGLGSALAADKPRSRARGGDRSLTDPVVFKTDG